MGGVSRAGVPVTEKRYRLYKNIKNQFGVSPVPDSGTQDFLSEFFHVGNPRNEELSPIVPSPMLGSELFLKVCISVLE
jgi:hypothetical protein